MRSLFESFHIVFFLRLRPKRIPGNSFILYVFLCSLSLSFYFSAKMLRNLLELVGGGVGVALRNGKMSQHIRMILKITRTEKCNENPFVDMALNFIRVVVMKLLSCCCQESTPFVADPSRRTLSQRASATFNGLLNASKGWGYRETERERQRGVSIKGYKRVACLIVRALPPMTPLIAG